jgi:hypothetical protein
MQNRPLALGGTEVSSAALNGACVHQQGGAFVLADAIAH